MQPWIYFWGLLRVFFQTTKKFFIVVKNVIYKQIILFFPDNFTSAASGLRKTCLGSSPDCRTYLCHAQLGNGTQKVGASFQGLILT